MNMRTDTPTRLKPITYRPEIDGIRALAVLAVVLFHAKFEVFSGGFVGVDIFFVISGYLITSIIYSDLRAENFTLTGFFERRARRILPALFLVILACLPLGWYLMLPDPFENFGQSIVATILFSNNILLTLTSGYWDLASEFKPLLHTWSLGVEEQYYLVAPLAMLAMARWSCGRIVVAFSLVAGLSLFMTEVGWRQFPTANFYLLPTRAWEFLIGALCALALPKGLSSLKEAAAALGLAMVLVPIFLFNAAMPFPSLWTLMPVVGSALLILAATTETFVGRFLAIPPMVGIGLISYSLYLWHQPIFAFARIASVAEPEWQHFLALLCLCTVLAYLSWRFVEQPFRNRGASPLRPFLFATGGVAVVLASAGLVLFMQKGFPLRLYPESPINNVSGLYIAYNESARKATADSFGTGQGPRVLVAGNSFARDFVNMAEETGWSKKIRLVYRDDVPRCMMPADPTSTQFGRLFLRADIIVFASGNYRKKCIGPVLEFARKEDKRVLFVGPKQFGYNLNPFMQVPSTERATARTLVLSEFVERNKRLRQFIPKANYVDVLAALLDDENRVPVFDGHGQLISADRGHLTSHGALFVGKRIFARPPLLGLQGCALMSSCADAWRSGL